MIFYLTATAVHVTGFMYLSYFFRYRRVGFLPILAISTAYYTAFENLNTLLYKTCLLNKSDPAYEKIRVALCWSR